jgi:hypothetical protein
MLSQHCRICGSVAASEEFTERTTFQCFRCGYFAVTSTALKLLRELSSQEIVTISGWIRENQNITIRAEQLEFLYNLRLPSVGEKAEKLLSYFAKQNPRPGATFMVYGIHPNHNQQHLELLGVSWASDHTEVRFLLQDYLCTEMRFIGLNDHPIPSFKILPKGWAYLDSLSRGNPQSTLAFVAMWFDDSMTSAWLAMERGVQEAGYSARRIDKKEHNNRIDDEIIAEIRRSKFLVADFTGHRGGVYFEAGFAKGLGLEVIWLCREDHLKDAHFDTRQYSHIPWKLDQLAELSKALQNRIEATIGRGPTAGSLQHS